MGKTRPLSDIGSAGLTDFRYAGQPGPGERNMARSVLVCVLPRRAWPDPGKGWQTIFHINVWCKKTPKKLQKPGKNQLTEA